jgi:hypothetical protein
MWLRHYANVKAKVQGALRPTQPYLQGLVDSMGIGGTDVVVNNALGFICRRMHASLMDEVHHMCELVFTQSPKVKIRKVHILLCGAKNMFQASESHPIFVLAFPYWEVH